MMKLFCLFLLCLLCLQAISALALPTLTSNATKRLPSTGVDSSSTAGVQAFTRETSIDRTCLCQHSNRTLDSLSGKAAITYLNEDGSIDFPKPRQLTGQILDERRCFENGRHQYLREFTSFLAFFLAYHSLFP